MNEWKASLEAVFLGAFGKEAYRRCITDRGMSRKQTKNSAHELPTPPNASFISPLQPQ